MNFHEMYNKKEKSPKKRGEIGPLITGSVVKGGFNRKLRMLRADLFATLSICKNGILIKEENDTKAIKRGIEQLAIDSQNIL